MARQKYGQINDDSAKNPHKQAKNTYRKCDHRIHNPKSARNIAGLKTH